MMIADVQHADLFPGSAVLAAEYPEVRELLSSYFGMLATGRWEAIDVQLALLERYWGGLIDGGLVDDVFRANGWKWPGETAQ